MMDRMERTRSKRYYYDQDYDSDSLPRTKQRYGGGGHHYSQMGHHRRSSAVGAGVRKAQESSLSVTTTYRILCHDAKAGGVIGKSGSIIKAIRQHTGAWINVHELIQGDEERIIEISDSRRRDPDGRMPSFSPAQEALLLIHERIVETDCEGFNAGIGGDEDDAYGPRSGGIRVATRLVVSRTHVGSLLGKGGKIIEQMRMETKTQIRVLPRDHSLPRCVAMSEEIVQVVGDINAVKNAVAIVSSRLRESQHRDRSYFHPRGHSPDRFYPSEDEFVPHMNNTPRRGASDGAAFGSRLSGSLAGGRNNNYTQRSFGGGVESIATPVNDSGPPFYGEDLVFRILCPIEMINRVVSEQDGILELLQQEIGVDVAVVDSVARSDEQVIVISSYEGPDDELFPAQEALLHIQNQIVELVPGKENVITTRLLIPSEDIGCLEGKNGSLLEIRRLTGADIQILPREKLPPCVSATDELLQIVGEIKAARDAVVEVTARLRDYMYQELFQKDMLPSTGSSFSSTSQFSSGKEVASATNSMPIHEDYTASRSSESSSITKQKAQTVTTVQPPKDFGGSSNEPARQTESESREDMPSGLNRLPVPLVTRSTLEVVIPPEAVPKLITKSRNKLAQISELSGANVKLVDDNPEVTEKVIQISGTPEQAERAQSLLQGFILSTQEDAP
ncbi:RNA-binding KH domain-containing protein RCF3 [Impatiens glandulifera]|uniref:RNA-binding KH domain-containing protein RCF3 n=1 Tax=Impatiens glandulifera TaxID=253017 RepID=UPI001FB17FA2|nr:RNA-binding KH domain-containing protein RCF3 [Impatiens glandulifera]